MHSLFFAFTAGILVFIPQFTFAHTSDERYVDGIVVDLSTAPIAPLVGEQTGFLFSFLDPETFSVISEIQSAKIDIIAQVREKNLPQAIIWSSERMPVQRGTLTFSHVFDEQAIYDVHLTFWDSSGVEHTTGFRRQVRDIPKSFAGDPALLALIASAGLLIGAGATAMFCRRASSRIQV
jgi:hypothetical protein